MPTIEPLRIAGFDYIEFAVANLDRASEPFHRMGFERVAVREILERKLHSYLMMQNGISVMLSHSELATDPVARFVATHGDGVFNVAFRCDDAVSTFETAVNRGAEVAEGPKSLKRDFGAVQSASILSVSDVRYSFVSRTGYLFAEGFEVAVKNANLGFGLMVIDHLAFHLESNQLEKAVTYYSGIFGMEIAEAFSQTRKPSYESKVMSLPSAYLNILLNEPPANTTHLDEFLTIHHGSGVSHIAFSSQDILLTLKALQKESLKLIPIPTGYYETLGTTVPGLTESPHQLAELGVLVDAGGEGYLLHAYSESAIGALSFEFIQRKGNRGFGETSLATLLDAVEQDRGRRGVLC